MKPMLNRENGMPSRCLRIYIPLKDSRTHQIKNGRMIKDLCAMLLPLLRGCTKYRAEGMWRNGDGKIIGENVIIVESFGSGENFRKAVQRIQTLLRKFKRQYRQESIAVLVDKDFYLI